MLALSIAEACVLIAPAVKFEPFRHSHELLAADEVHGSLSALHCFGRNAAKQECHSDTPRSAFTVSSVTTAPSALRGSSGIPFRLIEDCGRCKARRARLDTTSPMLRCCCWAIALAAISTSSSRDNVVRMLR